MQRLMNYADANGSYTLEAVAPADTINSVALTAATPATDTIPAGAKFVLVNSTNALYMRFGAAAAVPTTVSDGSASELVISSTAGSGWGVMRAIPTSTSTTGTVAASSAALTVASTDGFTKGDTVIVKGAAAAGADFTTTISSLVVSTGVITLAATATTAVTNAVVTKTMTTIGLVSPGTAVATLAYYK